ncbi:MAG: AAA family ATPase [Acidimicrobiia bacterium]
MRPKQLEVSGFIAFREPVVVDFSDADLFALTGATGAGKSSLIDAIVFALYGSVPRYGDKRAVAPLISVGKLEARVRFDFNVGPDEWTAVRVVRRRKDGGASTEEARLEHGDEVVAGTADEVTNAVEALLGLGFDHFIKSVVLPQGEFARFLHDRPAQRQALLRSLLDLGIFSEIRELAAHEAAALSERVRGLEARAADLDFATSQARADAEKRVAALERLHERLAESEPELERKIADAEATRKAARTAAEQASKLEGLEVPDEAQTLRNQSDTANHQLVISQADAKKATERLTAAESRRDSLGDRAELKDLWRGMEELTQIRKAHSEVSASLEIASSELISVRADAAESNSKLLAAREALEEAKSAHAAHGLAADLRMGDRCPVCRQVVTAIPTEVRAASLTAAQKGLRLVEDAHDSSEARKSAAEEKRARLEGRAHDLQERIDELERRLAGVPPRDELAAQVEAAEKADAELSDSRKSEIEAREAFAKHRTKQEQLEGNIDRLRKDFEQARDRVAKLDPPRPARDDPFHDWQQLAEWARARGDELTAEATEAEEAAARYEVEAVELADKLDEFMREHGLEPTDVLSREKASFAELAEARHQLDRISEAASELEKIRIGIEKSTRRRATSEMLALHLRADRFEAWLLDEALRALVAGANELLTELSQGSYSLWLAGRGFEVVDHRNADERRSVRTLSGGETFLVSLSLALSLSEQLSRLSTRGGSPMETIFLDEGFGTLDRESLDTVGGVIHELGARGRTVGIVTHVTELAEQVPVRFEVTKGAKTATVRRIDS